MTERVRHRREGSVAVLTLDRPDRLNALDASMVARLRDLVLEANADPDVRAILLTARGRAFGAGQDLSERRRAPGEPPPDLGESLHLRYNPLVRALRNGPTPAVAAVHGVAAGAGASLALAADVVIASTDARFAITFARVGLMPDAGGTWFLPRAVGRARASATAMLGTVLDATAARDAGLIWEVVPVEELPDRALAAARRLAGEERNDRSEVTWTSP